MTRCGVHVADYASFYETSDTLLGPAPLVFLLDFHIGLTQHRLDLGGERLLVMVEGDVVGEVQRLDDQAQVAATGDRHWRCGSLLSGWRQHSPDAEI